MLCEGGRCCWWKGAGLAGAQEFSAGLHGRETEVSLELELVLSSLRYPGGRVQDCCLRHLFSRNLDFCMLSHLQAVPPAARFARGPQMTLLKLAFLQGFSYLKRTRGGGCGFVQVPVARGRKARRNTCPDANAASLPASPLPRLGRGPWAVYAQHISGRCRLLLCFPVVLGDTNWSRNVHRNP